MTPNMNALVDADRGLVSRRIFIEQEIYEQELRGGAGTPAAES